MFAPLCGQSAELSVAATATQFDVKRLAPDQGTQQSIFVVDSATEILIDIVASVEGVEVAIEGPASQVVNKDNVGSMGGMFLSTELGSDDKELVPLPFLTNIGFHSFFSFPSLGPGTYIVHLTAPAGLGEETAVSASVFCVACV
jgi:hypothetical protein